MNGFIKMFEDGHACMIEKICIVNEIWKCDRFGKIGNMHMKYHNIEFGKDDFMFHDIVNEFSCIYFFKRKDLWRCKLCSKIFDIVHIAKIVDHTFSLNLYCMEIVMYVLKLTACCSCSVDEEI